MKEYQQELINVSPKVDQFFDQTFSKVVINRPANLKDLVQDCHVMTASTHRSHVDYFLLGNLLHHFGIENIRFAAGDNLMNFPYLGKRFRDWGAYAVERDRANSRNYLVDLCMKTVSMIEEKDSILVFPEMGRSYKGGMLEMKQVILTAAILAQARHPEKRVVYLPAAISYEQLPELTWFDIVLTGKRLRKPENGPAKRFIGSVLYFGGDLIAMGKFYHARRFGKTYGSVYVDVGLPIPVCDIVDLKADYNPQAAGEFWSYRTGAKKVSAFLFDQLQSLYRVLPSHLVAGALSQGATTRTEVRNRVPELMEQLRSGKRNLLTVEQMSTDTLIDTGLKQLRWGDAVRVQGESLAIRRKAIVDYYASALS